MEDLSEQELLELAERLTEEDKKLGECLRRYTRESSEDDTEGESEEHEIPTEKAVSVL